jgi:hypothetical protein
MSQKSVEVLLGKLVTDEELRRRFEIDPLEVFDWMRGAGWELTSVETEALRSLDPAAVERLAGALDPRLQKASLQQARRSR